MKYLKLLPRMLSVSKVTGFLPFFVIFTAFKCVFILMSTPAIDSRGKGVEEETAKGREGGGRTESIVS